MKHLLDTNICVHFLRGAFNLDNKFRSAGLENCFISEITLAELAFGVENSNHSYQHKHRASLFKFERAFEGRILPIRNCINFYAQNRARLRKSGLPISDFDLLIGCTALANNLVMVTENLSDFNRIENLFLENWVDRTL